MPREYDDFDARDRDRDAERIRRRDRDDDYVRRRDRDEENDGDRDDDIDLRSRRDLLEPHRGVLVLIMGLLGIFLLCPIFSVVAWVMGSADLSAMEKGRMDREGLGMTQAGYMMGMIWSIVWLVVMLIYALIVAIIIAIAAAVG